VDYNATNLRKPGVNTDIVGAGVRARQDTVNRSLRRGAAWTAPGPWFRGRPAAAEKSASQGQEYAHQDK